ncbi:MAG: sulfotransferase [bacterium]|nr:sulfotransferase family protein [Deltaproteobacteria bacterium]MCP4906127.1 sulfotransferase [bacterium]
MFRFSESIEEFHQTARDARGLDDFGEDDYREALEMLCLSLDEDTTLTPIGETAIQAMITDALQARLMVEAGWKQFPEAEDARIDRPLVIVGLPRTGTTALHHLIGQDPAIQALEHWIQRTPKPRPPRADWEEDPDYLASVERVHMMFSRSPDMRAIHEIEAHLPDECWNTFSQNFVHSSYEANADVRQYAQWWIQSDMTPVYRRHRRTAQLVGHREPEKRWLFKDATHLFDLAALFETYPDAMIVQTHRDPVQAIPSVCSLCWSARDALNEGMDMARFGRSTLALWEHSIFAMMKTREGRDPKQFFDLPFDRFVSDPPAAIDEIYAYFGLDFTPAANRSIREFRAENPKGKHGAHAYRADQWGLTASEIAERFRPYTEAYGIETASATS